MPRNRVILKFPTLNDKGGDLTKKWYVEFYYRIPGDPKPRYTRISKGLCSGTDKQRRTIAERIIAEETEKLKRPDLFIPQPDSTDRIMQSDTYTRPEADRYAAFLALTHCDTLREEYMEYRKPSVRHSSFLTYKSKLKIFSEYICTYLPDRTPPGLEHKDILAFFNYLVRERKVSKQSINRYKQCLHEFYEWIRKEKKLIKENPIHDIPNYGLEVDLAPMPIMKDEISALKEAIRDKDPWLWLQCELQYYCAIRPGHEIRLMKVQDIDLQRLTITIPAENAKNHKKAVVPITTGIADTIKKLGIMNYAGYLYVFSQQNHPGEKPLGERTMKERFNKIRDSLGIRKSVKFYSWKHTGAISMVENGVDVWKLQQHMRHASVVTTEEYIRKRSPQARQAQDFIDEL